MASQDKHIQTKKRLKVTTPWVLEEREFSCSYTHRAQHIKDFSLDTILSHPEGMNYDQSLIIDEKYLS